MPATILVTGGAGFIGSHLVDTLVEKGHDVRVVDCLLGAAHRERPDYLNPGAELIEGDLRDPAVATAAVRGVDAVSHQAAMVGLGAGFGDTADYVAHNSLGTANLLGALEAGRFDGRLVLAASMVVYGEGSYRCPEHGAVAPPPRIPADLDAGRFEPPCPVCGEALEPEPVTEAAPADPRSVYAATKAEQEHLCAAYGRQTGATVTALRYHNVYGPRMPFDTPYAGVASIFRSSLERGEAPRVFEDGCQMRDFVHVSDVAAANVTALLGDQPIEGPVNVCSGSPRTVGEMALALSKALEGPEPVVTGEFRLGDVRHVFASNDRARSLGLRAHVEFEDGIRGFAFAPLRGSR